jgi:hypothetical protein
MITKLDGTSTIGSTNLLAWNTCVVVAEKLLLAAIIPGIAAETNWLEDITVLLTIVSRP